MNKFIYSLLVILSLTKIINAQSLPVDLTKEFINISAIGNGDFNKAEKDYKNLINLCEEEKQYNIMSLCYANLGYIYHAKGDFEKAKAYFEKGIEAGNKSLQKSGVASNFGGIGQIYQEMEAHEMGRSFINQGIDLLEKNKTNDEFRNTTLGNLYTFLSFSKISVPNIKYTIADSLKIRLKLVEKALKYYNEAPLNYFDKRSVGYINLASVQQDMKLYHSAVFNLGQALKYNHKKKNIRTYSRIYLGLAMSYQGMEKYDSVIFYSYKFLNLQNNNDAAGQLEAYECLADAYKSTNQQKLSEKYYNQYLELDNKLNKNKLKSVAKVYEENTQKTKKLGQYNIMIINISFFILILLLGSTFYMRSKYRKEKKLFSDFRNQLNEIKVLPETNRVLKNNIKLTEAISNSTELHILNGLKEFENNLQFIQKGITQGNLASELQTNVRYLSEIIKKYKAENFNSYINNLRINYIIHKIETESLYRKYKISYLAEACGFPTSASFTKIFKEITGLTPSSYLVLLSKEKDLD